MPGITDKNIPGEGQQIDVVVASAPTPAGKNLPSSTGRQLAWFIGLYCAGLVVTGLVVYFFHALIRGI
jgi:hypothetical protein